MFKPNKVKRHLEQPIIHQPHQGGRSLKLTPLGGIGDVTKNMYIYEYGNDIVIIDCGVGFPDEAMPGIDLVIPDISYLRDKKSKIRGILITHAHDDHIGGLPYIWPELDVEIYAQKLTAGLIRSKFSEHRLPKDKIKNVGLKQTIKLGSFEASFYQVSHSIPDSTGIVLRTPVGTLIHQADFKMDWTPVNNQVTDVGTVARVGEQGVLFMSIDCLRVEKQGYTLSEKTIEGTFSKVESETRGKVLITMTSSNITRVQQAINVAIKAGRKLALSGRSVENNFQVARDLGYLDVPPGLVINQESIKSYPENKLMILIAGSQGQPGSSLSRAANGDHKYIHFGKLDSVVFSADPIPSTESAQHALIDNLTKLGCDVYYSALTSDLHVSGHASSEELKLMINLAKPKYLLPIGGTFRHMKEFSRMAKSLGYEENQILLPTEGQVIDIKKDRAYISSSINVANVYVDGLGVGDVGTVVLRDRQVMAEEGIVVVVVPVEPQTGKVGGEPDIISRGFVFEKQAEDLLEAAKEIVKSCLRDHKPPLDWRYIRHTIEENLEKFFFEETKRSPLILTVVVEV
ncbi:ribonuclease J [Candidatus Daviesbacteria bacterium]|nr:ribonuclease J [Candidatus Daviesbacteria bacterium]